MVRRINNLFKKNVIYLLWFSYGFVWFGFRWCGFGMVQTFENERNYFILILETIHFFNMINKFFFIFEQRKKLKKKKTCINYNFCKNKNVLTNF